MEDEIIGDYNTRSLLHLTKPAKSELRWRPFSFFSIFFKCAIPLTLGLIISQQISGGKINNSGVGLDLIMIL